MIALLMKVKPYLPDLLWRTIRNCYWIVRWERERLSERFRLRRFYVPKLAHSERATLIEAVADAYPFSTVLEVGCALGQNFTHLAPIFPDVSFVGIDPDAAAIARATKFAEARPLPNVDFSVLAANALGRFESESFDVVFSSACLLYIGPEEIERVIHDIFRIASRKVILVEQQREGLSAKGELGPQKQGDNLPREQPYWIRDYVKLIRAVAPESSIFLKKIPNPLWVTEQWQEHATLIEVSK